jgi:hypothetical protein
MEEGTGFHHKVSKLSRETMIGKFHGALKCALDIGEKFLKTSHSA